MELFVFLIFAFVLIGIVKGGRRARRRHRQIGDLVDEVLDDALEGVRSRRGTRRGDEPPPPPPFGARRPVARRSAPASPAPDPLDFRCDHCGGQQDGPLDLSPSGDVKCAFCGNWFNVRT